MDEIEEEALNHNAQTRKRKLAVVLTHHVIKQLHFLTETVNKIASKLSINSCESCKVNPSSVAGLENVEFMLEATGGESQKALPEDVNRQKECSFSISL